MLSMATVLNQKAIVSVDYEYVNYQNANISEIEDDYNGSMEQTTNQDIEDYLRATHNFRVGAEYRFNSLFSLRAGYAFWDSPTTTKLIKIITAFRLLLQEPASISVCSIVMQHLFISSRRMKPYFIPTTTFKPNL